MMVNPLNVQPASRAVFTAVRTRDGERIAAIQLIRQVRGDHPLNLGEFSRSALTSAGLKAHSEGTSA